jgi:hypothetical protein
MGRAVHRFTAPVARWLAPWLLAKPHRAVGTLLYAATAVTDEVGAAKEPD